MMEWKIFCENNIPRSAFHDSFVIVAALSYYGWCQEPERKGKKNCEKFYNCTWWRICEKWYLRESIFMVMFRRHNVGFNECLSLYISQIVKANIVQAWRWKILKELNASIKLLCVSIHAGPGPTSISKGFERISLWCAVNGYCSGKIPSTLIY